ncbi:hypothetical protein BDW69DRAFT_176536 [Aspergillus filifer]
MSLKRKASFPSIASPQSPQKFFNPMDDSPKHLNSRTKKRVRNDRPDEQAVYDKTLRWLFTAQQRVHHLPTPPAEPELESDQEHDEDAAMQPEPTPDYRQQSLLQFFRPAQPQPSRQLAQSTPVSQFENIQGGNDFSHGQGVGIVHPATPSESATMDMTMAMTPVPGLADRNINLDGDGDMDMDMDL